MWTKRLNGAGLARGQRLLLALPQDFAGFAADVVRHFHLNRASRYPHILLELAARTSDVPAAWLAAGAAAYALVRFVEAYGLWRQRRWAERLGALSGAIYVPIELTSLRAGARRERRRLADRCLPDPSAQRR